MIAEYLLAVLLLTAVLCVTCSLARLSRDKREVSARQTTAPHLPRHR